MSEIFIIVVIPILLIVYFELLGKTAFKLLRFSSFTFYFPIGLFLVLGITYPLSILTNNNCSFYLFSAILLILFCISLFFIVKNYKFEKYKYKHLLIMIIITVLLTIFSAQTTLGNLDGFDVVHYLNMTTQNIGLDSFNSKDIYFNTVPEFSMTYYSSEVYYYFAGAIIYIFGKLATLLKIKFYYSTCFIWVFQILFNSVIGALFIEGINRYKKLGTKIFYFVVLVLIFGKLYFNNALGFFGNSFYTLCLSYVSIVLIEFLQSRNRRNLLLIYILLYSMCSFSTSGIFTFLFVLIGLFFVNDNYEKDYIWYAALIYLPISNALFMERNNWVICYIFPSLLSLIVIVFRKYIFILFNDKKRKIIFLIFLFVCTFLLSRKYSQGFFDFSGLLNNNSQIADMTLNYFSLKYDSILIAIYKIVIIVILFTSLLINRNNKYIYFIFTLIIVIFNPFSCNFINRYINVYYRAYDIFINPFSIIYLFDTLIIRLNNKYSSLAISIVVSFVLLANMNIFKPIYYNECFVPLNDYNFFYKMSNDQFDIIDNLRSNIDYYGEENPYIISSNILTQSMIPNGKYMFARGRIISNNWTSDELKLYEIFYPPEYLGDKYTDNPDYDNILNYINNSRVNYVVVDKKVEYYDKHKQEYSYLFYKVSEACDVLPVYDNDSFSIYHFNY